MKLMSFLKKFLKKDPYDRLKEDFSNVKIKNKALNLYEALSKHDSESIRKIVAEEKIDGIFVGNQGWFLPKHEKKLELVWDKLRKGAIDLEAIGKDWGLNSKRVFIVLGEHAKKLKLKEPYFIRKSHTLFLSTYFKQIWNDLISTVDFEEEEKFDSIISRVNIKSEYFDIFKEEVTKLLKTEDSIVALGRDGFLRRKDEINEMIAEYINEKWEEKVAELSYIEIGDEFGLSIEEITRTILKLIDDKLLNNTTNYPVDEILKPRM